MQSQPHDPSQSETTHPKGSVSFDPVSIDEISFDQHGLVPAVIQDDATNAVLMVGYMSPESLQMSVEQGRTVFWSRSRQELWRKGDTSGDHQYIKSIRVDCDADTLLIRVEQTGNGACHTGEYSCFYREMAS